MTMPMPGVTRNPLLPENLAKLMKESGRLIIVPTGVGWTEVLVNTGTSSLSPFRIVCSSGTTASSSAVRYVPIYGLRSRDADATYVDWDKKLYIFFSMMRVGGADAEAIARFQIKEVVTEGILAAKGIGVHQSGGDYKFEGYGSSRGQANVGGGDTADQMDLMTIVHNPSIPKIELFKNGTLAGSITASANIPTGDSGAAAKIVCSVINGATAANRSESFSNIMLWQEK